LHHIQEITTFTAYVTACDLQKSFSFDMTVETASYVKGKGKGFPLLSVEPGADPGVQAVRPQVTISHPPSGRLPLLSARPAVTFPATQHYRPLAGIKL